MTARADVTLQYFTIVRVDGGMAVMARVWPNGLWQLWELPAW